MKNELYHHGIKGQKWGIRRFQNEDGTRTAAGKRYYSDDYTSIVTSNYKAAKKELNKAKVALHLANERYQNRRTADNFRKYNAAGKRYSSAKKEYDSSRFDYKVNKERNRLDDKGKTFENKSKHRLKLEEQYRNNGLTPEEAEAAANNRIRTEKILAGVAAVTVTAAVAYGIHKYAKSHTDQLIKAGDIWQRIESDSSGKLYDTFYAAGNAHDKQRYASMYGYAREKSTGNAYKMTLAATKDIKVASMHTAKNTFKELYENNSTFRNNLNEAVGHKPSYDMFNKLIVGARLNPELDSAYKQYFNALADKGYGAIQDINDMKYSGYAAKNPLIFFNNSSDQKMIVKTTEKMLDISLEKATNETYKALSEDFINKYLGVGLTAGGGFATANAAIEYNKDVSKNERITARRS